MKPLNEIIRTNRYDVFRHTLRSIALASAAASGLGLAGASGCTEAHVVLPLDQGPSWAPMCSTEVSATDITGLPLPAGADGLIAYGTLYDLSRPQLVAGSFCVDGPERPDCSPGVPFDTGESFSIFIRRNGVVERVALDEVVSAPIVLPQQALLVALGAGYRLWCEGEPASGVNPASATPVAGGFEVVANRYDCFGLYEATLLVTEAGEVQVLDERLLTAIDCAVIGRLTDGTVAPARSAEGSDLGRYFAQVAGLEAAAVDAFERMAAELSTLGAPTDLVQWARASADDERRHTRDMGALAERFAVTPAVHPPQAFALRGLFEVALENAVEGCVRETYGAVVGHHQAAHAQDPVVRAAMAQLAEDETRHAALSWAVAEWALPQLSEAERAEIRAAQRAAIDALARSVSLPESDLLLRDAGLPAPDVALAMVQGLAAQVWA
ncbi:MAG: ferritin-like domain-containing protein [Sandaracinaceae bacterium]|nr:ferritin-like domain-containing protein [Sandaracinaceae bacterium]